jgi:periplasmic protein TonB
MLVVSSLCVHAENNELTLNGMASFEQLRKEYYIGALYLGFPGHDSATIANMPGKKRMQINVTADRWPALRFSQMWNQAITINNASAFINANALDILAFTSVPKGDLVEGDRLIVELTGSNKTQVSLNGAIALRTNSPALFTMLLNAWIGARPPTSEFKRDILELPKNQAGNDLVARFENIRPSDARKKVIAGWGFKTEPEAATTTAAAVASTAAATAATATAAPTAPIAATAPPKPEPVTPPKPEPAAKSIAEAKPAAETKPVEPPKPAPEAKPEPKPIAEAKPVETPKPAPEVKPEPKPVPPPVVAATETPKPAPVAPPKPTPAKPAPAPVVPDAAAVAAAKAAHDAQQDDLLNGYFSTVRKQVLTNIQYPRRAVKENIEGMVMMRIKVNRNGGLNSVEVAQSADDLLDAEGERAVKKAAPFPKPAETLEGNDFEFIIPIVFKLTQ